MGKITQFYFFILVLLMPFFAMAQDTTNPVAVCMDITVQLDAFGSAMIIGDDVDGGSTDDTAVDTLTVTPDTFSCADIGMPVTVTLTVSDAAGNMDTCTAVVTVEDMLPPTASCQDITVNLDAMGMATITADMLDNGSSDNCGLPLTFSASQTSFSCADIGPNSVTLTVTDGSGNSSQCVSIVTVQDTMPPTAMCQDITVPLDASGLATITADMLDGGSTDNCGGPLTFVASQTNFTCTDTGSMMVTLTVTDSNGLTDTCMAMVTVNDVTPPDAICQDVTLQLDSTGNITVPASTFDNGSSDNCGGPVTFSASRTTFDCNDVLFDPAIKLVLTGVISGPLSSGTTPKAIELYALDYIGDLSIYGIGIANDGSGSDGQEYAFPNVSLALGESIIIASESADYNTFFGTSPDFIWPLLDIDGDDAVELYLNGIISDRFGEATYPTPPPMTTVDWAYNEGWAYRISNSGPDDASFVMGNWYFSTPGILEGAPTNDMAIIPFPSETYSAEQAGVNMPIVVTLTVSDASGNMSSCIANVTIQDVTPPTAIAQDITLQLDANGEVFLDVTAFNNGSNDSCTSPTNPDGISTFVGSPSAFFCADVGVNTVTLTVTDLFGNEDSTTAIVTVEDNVAPDMVCENITVQLDATGSVTITPSQVGGDSFDVCGITVETLDIDTFSCADIGPNMVTYTATDVNGNSDTCTAMVTVEDMVAPTMVCQALTLQLNASGMATLNAIDIDGGSTDACGIASRSVDVSTFDCTNLGANNVELTVTDVNGNSASCIAIVTIEDMINPVAAAMDITVGINTSGSTTILGTDVDNGSTDNCAITTYSVSPDTFTCADVGTPVAVVLTVTDASGNSHTANANVTVVDNVPPSVVCQNITMSLDASGNVNITPADVDGGSSVSCGTLVSSIDISSFDCTNIGQNNVVLTVTNSNNVSRSCTAVVTIVDLAAPVVVCQDISVVLDGSGNATITAADIDNGSSDNCGIASTTLDITSFDCSDVGTNNVQLTVTDINGNSSVCSAVVTVSDDIPPIVACQNITLQLDATGNASIVALDVDSGSTDFCGIASRSIDVSSFDCNDIGANTVVLTVTDTSGNSASCNAIVTVEDTVGPAVICQNITVQLDTAGTATIAASDIDNGSTDSCGIATLDIDQIFFSCANIGSNNVTLTVTDVNGNSSSCTATVTVEDNIPPTISCQDITVQLDASGNANISVFDIDGGSSDACGIATSSIDISAFDCDDLGINSVTLTVSDLNGNVSTCVANVTIQDVEDPVIDCPGVLTETITPGTLYTVPDFIASNVITASDNCSSILTTVSQAPVIGSQLAVGTYSGSILTEDESGNQESCVFTLIVSDTALNIEGNQSFSSLKLYPNPTASMLVLDNSQLLEINEVNFYDLSGRLVKKILFNGLEQQMEMDISNLSTAAYLVEIVGAKGRIIKQIIKE